MNITYTGRQDKFTPQQQKKLDARFAKLAKLLDLKGGERKARIILTSERHLKRAEINVSVYDHPMVGVASEADQFTALLAAAERLEKQVLKFRTKKRDTKREPKKAWPEAAAPAAVEASSEKPRGRRIFRVDEHEYRKPMTIEEALVEMDQKRDYVVFRDPKSDRLSVLLRRRDGHFDLVEG
jgi:putative sigma-54 modulation protein